MAYLILVRHGKSEWNKLGQWTGLTDVGLAEEGRTEARLAAAALNDIEITSAHTSLLKRAQQTLEEMKAALGLQTLQEKKDAALNERDYGIYTGKNKWQVKEAIGEEAFQKLRRGWDVAVPEGETLKDVHDRVVPYYTAHIHPEVAAGKNVLVVAHGNSLRALAKHLEDMDERAVCELEIGTGEVYCYEFDGAGALIGKTIRAANPDKLRT